MQKDRTISRAQGCLLGQLAGDSLGSLVEFRSPEDIQHKYPAGVRDLEDGGVWNTIAGQPTDDSEMALALARVLAQHGRYDRTLAFDAYIRWLGSGPFDCGDTVRNGLQGALNWDSQANGAMMRISPLGIFGANYELEQVAEWAHEDAALTHPHPVCQQANSLYALAIAYAVRAECEPQDLYERIQTWAREHSVESTLMSAVDGATVAPPADYMHQPGLGSDGVPQRAMATAPRRESRGSCRRYRPEGRRHRHQRCHLRSTAGRGAWTRSCPRTVGEPALEMPAKGRGSQCPSTSPRVLLADRCASAC